MSFLTAAATDNVSLDKQTAKRPKLAPCHLRGGALMAHAKEPTMIVVSINSSAMAYNRVRMVFAVCLAQLHSTDVV